MEGLASVYGNHLGARLLGLNSNKNGGSLGPSDKPNRQALWGAKNDAGKQKKGQQHKKDDDNEPEGYEDEVIEEMSGNWSSKAGRVDSAGWTKMEEGPDEETVPSSEMGDDGDLSSPPKNLKRKRKPLDEKASASALDQAPGKKRLSCIDCGCRAALKACSKVMCIDCCPKQGHVCDAHAKKLYEKEVRKLEPASGSLQEKEHNRDKDKSAKKRMRMRDNGEHDDDPLSLASGVAEDSDSSPDRDGEQSGGEPARQEERKDEIQVKRSVLYDAVVKQDKKIRAMQSDLKELRTLLLSVIDKQSSFSRQLHRAPRHRPGGLVIDEEDEGDKGEEEEEEEYGEEEEEEDR